jgi:phthalate 4,5-dioxygenase
MLSREDNELITRVGPGTAMGDLMRQYWLPALHSFDLHGPDGPPRRLRLLGEDLVAFRDTGGRVGLLADGCPHRGASLYYGRNEEGGLRCIYHGWKFDVAGRCLDIPNESTTEAFRGRIRATAYSCREVNGIVWAYLGPRAEPPPLPELPWAAAPEARRSALKYQRACNWLQALEGDIDTSHLAFLHARLAPEEPSAAPADDIDRYRSVSRMARCPELHVVETGIGVLCGAERPADPGRVYWRVSQFLMPIFTFVPGYGGRDRAKAWVPLDDTHTMVWETHWSTERDLTPDERAGRDGRIPKSGFLPDTDDGLGMGRFAANQSNDYLQDRKRQKTFNFSGFEESMPLQDAAVQESMGPTVDRTREHLGRSDAAIVAVRRKLLAAARQLQEGRTPSGVDEPSLYRRRGCQMLLPAGTDWIEAARETANAGDEAVRKPVPPGVL